MKYIFYGKDIEKIYYCQDGDIISKNYPDFVGSIDYQVEWSKFYEIESDLVFKSDDYVEINDEKILISLRTV